MTEEKKEKYISGLSRIIKADLDNDKDGTHVETGFPISVVNDNGVHFHRLQVCFLRSESTYSATLLPSEDDETSGDMIWSGRFPTIDLAFKKILEKVHKAVKCEECGECLENSEKYAYGALCVGCAFEKAVEELSSKPMFNCSVCREDVKRVLKRETCTHSFCVKCYGKTINKPCPLCRSA